MSAMLEINELTVRFGNIAVVERDERTCSYEVGYCLGHAFWGRGIMPEALRAVIRYLFEGESDLQRVFATHDLRNPKSGRVMQKAGMTRAGVFRRADGEFHFPYKFKHGTILTITEEECDRMLGHDWTKWKDGR